MIRMQVVFAVFVLFYFIAPLSGCKKSDDKNENPTSTNTTTDTGEIPESDPTIGNLEIGGLPTNEEAGLALEMSEEERNTTSSNLVVSSSTLTLDLSTNDSSSPLHLAGNPGLFGFVSLFGAMNDMATHPAKCNFDLILKTPEEDIRPARKVADYNVYFVDGFGTVGLAEQGRTFCPTKAAVEDWAQAARVRPGTPTGTHDLQTEFYPPTRIVFYKKGDGIIRWRIVFFPKDFIEKLAKRISPFQKLITENLDFIAFTGAHTNGTKIGEAAGEVTINWNELRRMMTTLDGLNLVEDGGPPSGKVRVTYDKTTDPQYFTTTFLDDFSFPSGDGPMFEANRAIVRYKSGDENYLHFSSPTGFAKPTDPGPVGFVQFGDYNPATPANLGAVRINEVPEASYLSTPSIAHGQLIWKDFESGLPKPDEFHVVLTALQGDAFIYGDVEAHFGSKPDNQKVVYRAKAPLAKALTSERIAEINTFFANQGRGIFLDEDGYRNLLFAAMPGEDGSQPEGLIGKTEALSYFPSFEKFKFVDVRNEEDSPIK